jgi:hypothetical protein
MQLWPPSAARFHFTLDALRSVRKSARTWRLPLVLKKFAGVLLVASFGIGSGWILRGQESHPVAVVYYWKARPGKLDDYNRYIKTVAEPVDADARSHGAFVSITTFVSRRSDSP